MASTALDILGMIALVFHYIKLGNARSGKIQEKLSFTPDPTCNDLPAEGKF